MSPAGDGIQLGSFTVTVAKRRETPHTQAIKPS